MELYGYTRICSEGGPNGKESQTSLFGSEKERNGEMYKDYAHTFDVMAEEEPFDKEDGGYADADGNGKQTEEEFLAELAESTDAENDVFGLIQAYGFHVQFEPFVRDI